MKYNYIDKNKKQQIIEIDNKLSNIVNKAKSDFEVSRDYIKDYEFFIWRESLKSYHLSVKDRQIALWTDNWRANISVWLVRAFTDILVASLNDKPLNFQVKWINKEGFKNASNIKKTLDYISDVTWFHSQIKKSMRDWLITWNIVFRVWYKEIRKKETYYTLLWDETFEEIIENEEANLPYATNVSIFNVFPDPYDWPLRYITERQVISYENFIKSYGWTIRWKTNQSPLWNEEFLQLLTINNNWADKQDYWDIVKQIHKFKNSDYKTLDTYNAPDSSSSNSFTSENIWDNTSITDWLLEVKTTWYNNRLVIIVNNYPVYVWSNPYGFIPYIYKASNDTEYRFGEWIWYWLIDIEKVSNSSTSNYIDSVRSVANPTLVVEKNLLIDEEALEDWTPWSILYTEDNRGGNVAYALDKWKATDFWLSSQMKEIWVFLTWVSEYNMWGSARERTATWALAVAESAQKRLSPYVSSFLDSISMVAEMWMKLVKKYWIEEQLIYILDEDGQQFWESIKNSDLTGWVNITLQAEWMYWVNQSLELNKLIDMYNLLAPSWFVNANEVAKEIVKKNWFSPDKFITNPWEWVKPDNHQDILGETNQTMIPWKNKSENDAENIWNEVWQAVTPNTDLGNWGKWQQ